MKDKAALYDYLASKANPYRLISAIYVLSVNSITSMFLLPLLISIYKYNNDKKNIDLMLCVLVLFFDLSSACIAISDSISTLANYKGYISTSLRCNIVFAFNYILYTSSIYLMGIISLERCLLIVYKKEYSHRFYFGIFLASLSSSLIIATIASVTNGVDILPNALYCFLVPYTTTGLVCSILVGLSCGISYALMVYCYTTICIYRRNQSRCTQLDLGLDPEKVRREINIVIIKSLAIMATNLSTSGVYMAILAVTWFNPRALTNVTDMIQVIFIQPSMIINTLILLNMKPDLWKGLKKLYGFDSE